MTDAAFLELLSACERLAEAHGRALPAIQNLTSDNLEGRGHNEAALLAYQEQEKATDDLDRFRDLVARYKQLFRGH